MFIMPRTALGKQYWMSLSECTKVKQQTYSKEISVSQWANYKSHNYLSLLVYSVCFQCAVWSWFWCSGLTWNLRSEHRGVVKELRLSTPWLPTPTSSSHRSLNYQHCYASISSNDKKQESTHIFYKPAWLCWQGIECPILTVRQRVHSLLSEEHSQPRWGQKSRVSKAWSIL